jgi:hypothetical protein
VEFQISLNVASLSHLKNLLLNPHIVSAQIFANIAQNPATLKLQNTIFPLSFAIKSRKHPVPDILRQYG